MKYLKELTGLSEATCTSAVNNLTRKTDGKLEKVYIADVKKKATQLTERPNIGVRPVSAERKARLRAEMTG